MSDKTAISWTDATFNPWWGCTKISPACDHCYAERDAKRFAPGRVLWGVDAERREFGAKHWDQPKTWNDKAEREGGRLSVFCASMADVFDKNAPAGAREQLWQLIIDTPNLDWLLLTKRIGNARAMLPSEWLEDEWPDHVRLGSTVVNQDEFDRDVPKLVALGCPNFVSVEPMLGPIDMRAEFVGRGAPSFESPLHWVIAGGESGPKARPTHPAWFRSLRDQCAVAGVPFHFKQWGEWADAWTCSGGDLKVSQWTDGALSARVGKKAAGRLLDGVEHNGVPA